MISSNDMLSVEYLHTWHERIRNAKSKIAKLADELESAKKELIDTETAFSNEISKAHGTRKSLARIGKMLVENFS